MKYYEKTAQITSKEPRYPRIFRLLHLINECTLKLVLSVFNETNRWLSERGSNFSVCLTASTYCPDYLKTVPSSASFRKFPSSMSNTKPLQLRIISREERNKRLMLSEESLLCVSYRSYATMLHKTQQSRNSSHISMFEQCSIYANTLL